jgi:hypothetical protein
MVWTVGQEHRAYNKPMEYNCVNSYEDNNNKQENKLYM